MKCCINPDGFCSIHELIDVLISAIEAKDEYTRGHSDRVADFTSLLCQSRLMTREAVAEIHMAAHLHDIGKIYVPDAVLNKTGRLTESDWEKIKKHPVVGAQILSNIKGFDAIVQMVRSHHERWDGSGYPDGLRGEDIPLGARIIAVSDAVDAMLTDRPYRSARSKETCIKELKRCSGIHFDPEIVELAVALLSEDAMFDNSSHKTA